MNRLVAAEVPLAEVTSLVARFLHHAWEHGSVGVQPVGHTAFDVGFDTLEMLVNALPSRKLAGHHGHTTGRTDRAVDGEVGEINALAGHPIEIWRFAEGAAMNAKVAVPPIIGKDENDVGFGRFVGRQSSSHKQEQK